MSPSVLTSGPLNTESKGESGCLWAAVCRFKEQEKQRVIQPLTPFSLFCKNTRLNSVTRKTRSPRPALRKQLQSLRSSTKTLEDLEHGDTPKTFFATEGEFYRNRSCSQKTEEVHPKPSQTGLSNHVTGKSFYTVQNQGQCLG